MSNFIIFILILVPLSIIIFIIARKFSQLTVLDVRSIPVVQIEEKKDNLLKHQLETKSKAADQKKREMIRPLVQLWKNSQLAFRQYVGRIERIVVERAEKNKRIEPKEKRMQKRENLRTLLQEGNFALEQKQLETAEHKFIDAIKLDARNEEAYVGLGKVYLGQGHIAEARETFEFLLKISPGNESAIIKMAEICDSEDKKDEAIEYYQLAVLRHDSNPALFARLAELLLQVNKNDTALEAVQQAVELEPQNPKYLDRLVEISLLCNNKKTADEAYQQLRMVNPENQKLAVFKERIEKL